MKMTYCTAIREALFKELQADASVILMGEDIEYDVYRYTTGLVEQFGKERVRDIPLSEAAATGTAIGAAMTGLRPVLDLTMTSFLYVAADQIISMASKTGYQYGGQFVLPLTIMAGATYGRNAAAQHSDRPHSMFMNVPGIKIIAPATVKDMYGMLRAAIRENNPVICFEDRTLFPLEADVDEAYIGEIGKANIVQSGTDVTVITISGALQLAIEASEELRKDGISCEIIDMCTLNPLDKTSFLESAKKTGHAVIVDIANKTCSAASEISSILAYDAFEWLKAPINIVAAEDVPVPFSTKLERQVFPTKEKIVTAILENLKSER